MDDEYSGEQQRPSGHGHHQASTTELMENAKYLASAAQSAAGGKASSIDKAKAASAAEEFLGAAQQYGKFDETSGVGKYVGKAEDYLHKYHSSDTQNTGGRRQDEDEDEDEAPVSDNRRHERREEDDEGYGREEGGGRRHERRGEDDEGYGREEGGGRRHERRGEDDEGYGREKNEDRRRQEEDGEETGSGGGSGVGEYINMAKGFFK